ncbi:uncharacterized protein LOC127874554 isoform X1 [Dreissena polymorpha]|uniref:uncharacterized protein LOC127874554 isoform X1 n=1 Tax=Dreissena polymorpha TaxID=45954 RepID=UPI0022650660|nr:uncharacterized protein LOC127874554 isoform X1 [Dreissena polymorpha]
MITNGCIDAIIKTGHKKEIYQVVVNDPGTLAAVTVEMGPVMVMDLVTHSRMYEISNILGRRYGGRYMLFDSYMLLTRVSSRLFFIGGYVGERTDNEVQLFCWVTEQKIEPFELCDREAVKIVMANVYRLDDDRIMTTGKGDNYDFRVSTPCTGAPMERFSTQPAITSGNTRLLTSSRGLFTMETNPHRRLGLNAVFPYIQPKRRRLRAALHSHGLVLNLFIEERCKGPVFSVLSKYLLDILITDKILVFGKEAVNPTNVSYILRGNIPGL